MPKNVKKSVKNSLTANTMEVQQPQITDTSVLSERSSFWSKKKFGLKTPVLAFLVFIIVLGLLGFLLKDKFLVATINGRPVFRYELTQRLTSTYGKEALENLIVEKLIKDEAKKRGVSVSEQDVEQEAKKLEKSLGEGVTLEDALKFQGVSLADFKKQLELRLQLNKILEKEITISEEEVTKFIEENGKTLVATGEAERKTEARKQLKEQKINESLQTWIEGLLAKAKITRFLK